MNNEKMNQIISDAWANYQRKVLDKFMNDTTISNYAITNKEEFINKCKTDSEFSERWGLKIEERELTTVQERKKYDNYFDDLIGEYLEHHETLDKRGVPRKIITVTYNNEKIEVYE